MFRSSICRGVYEGEGKGKEENFIFLKNLWFSKRWLCLASPSIRLWWYYRASSSFLSSASSSILSLKFSWCGFKALPLTDTIFQNLDDLHWIQLERRWIKKNLHNIKILERTMPSFLRMMCTLVVKEIASTRSCILLSITYKSKKLLVLDLAFCT